MAVANEVGHILFPDIHYNVEGNFGAIEMDGFTAGNKIPLVKLDDVLDPPKLKLIKIDVEGMEHKVISGANALIEKHRPFLHVENNRMEKSSALVELIQSLDYRL